MFSKTIESVGVEVECGISQTKLDKLKAKYGPTGRFSPGVDHSVTVPAPPGAQDWIYNEEMHYFSTSPQDLAHFFEDTFRDNARLGAITNHSCGMHTHIRMDPSLIFQWSYKITVQRFLTLYKAKFKDNPKYMSRLVNHFTVGSYNLNDAIDQVTHSIKGSYRYRAVNLNAYFIDPQRGTMEIRILPGMRDAQEAINAIEWLVSVVDDINLHKGQTVILSKDRAQINVSDPTTIRNEILGAFKQKNIPVRRRDGP